MLKYICLNDPCFNSTNVTDVHEAEAACLTRIYRLAILDAMYLKRHPNTPRLRESDVRLESPPQSTECLRNVGALLEAKVADIESWVAWRIAELNRSGKKAAPYLIKKEGRYSLAIQLLDDNDEHAGFEVFFDDGRIEYRETV